MHRLAYTYLRNTDWYFFLHKRCKFIVFPQENASPLVGSRACQPLLQAPLPALTKAKAQTAIIMQGAVISVYTACTFSSNHRQRNKNNDAPSMKALLRRSSSFLTSTPRYYPGPLSKRPRLNDSAYRGPAQQHHSTYM